MGRVRLSREKIERIKQKANANHQGMLKLWKRQIDLVKETGLSLIVLRKCMAPTRWSSWVKNDFAGSPAAAEAYSLLACCFTDPRIYDVKSEGWGIDTLQGLVDALRAEQEGRSETEQSETKKAKTTPKKTNRKKAKKRRLKNGTKKTSR